MKKPLSQKIARLFEIVNYILLIPASLLEIGVLIYGVAITFAAHIIIALLCVIPTTLIYCFGTLLLYGYYKHRRNEINQLHAVWLWIGTILFNAAPLALMFFVLFTNDFQLNVDWVGRFWFYNIFGAYQIIILLAFIALFVDWRRNFD